MQKTTYKSVSFLFVFTYGLILYTSDLSSKLNTTSGTGYKFVPLIGLIVVLYTIYKLIESRLTSWNPSEYHIEFLIQPEIKSQNKCNYCGNPNITMALSNMWGQYCSIRCNFTGRRQLYYLLGVVFLAMSFIYDIAAVLIFAILMLIVGIWGIENHIPEHRYRYIKFKEDSKRNQSAEVGVKYARGPSDAIEQETDKEMIYVASLDREVKICCYQTARLDEKYCHCGRAIDDNLHAAVK